MPPGSITNRKIHWEWPEARKYTPYLGDFDAPSLFAKTTAHTVPIRRGKSRILDIGCGTGILGTYFLIAKGAKSVTFNDVLSKGIAVTFANLDWHVENHRIKEPQVKCLKAGFAEISRNVAVQHDLLVFNPPQLPMDHVSKAYRRHVGAHAWQKAFRDGRGGDGLGITKEFLTWYEGLRRPLPPAFILLSSFLVLNKIKDMLNGFEIKWTIAESPTRIPLRRILVEAAEKFDDTERGDRSLRRTKGGHWTKELLAVTVRRD
jgi:methylase of polypeptide subunit release factors